MKENNQIVHSKGFLEKTVTTKSSSQNNHSLSLHNTFSNNILPTSIIHPSTQLQSRNCSLSKPEEYELGLDEGMENIEDVKEMLEYVLYNKDITNNKNSFDSFTLLKVLPRNIDDSMNYQEQYTNILNSKGIDELKILIENIDSTEKINSTICCIDNWKSSITNIETILTSKSINFSKHGNSIPKYIFSDADFQKSLESTEYKNIVNSGSIYDTNLLENTCLLSKVFDAIFEGENTSEEKLSYTTLNNKIAFYLLLTALPENTIISNTMLAQFALEIKQLKHALNREYSIKALREHYIMEECINSKASIFNHTLSTPVFDIKSYIPGNVCLNPVIYNQSVGYCHLLTLTMHYLHSKYDRETAKIKMNDILQQITTINMLPPEEVLEYHNTFYSFNREPQGLKYNYNSPLDPGFFIKLKDKINTLSGGQLYIKI